MPQVFISYSEKDSIFAQLAKEKLEAEGIKVWLFEGDLHPGENWREAIDKGIFSSDVLMVILSPESSASSYVTYEWAYALGKGIKIIPIMLKETKAHPRLEPMQYFDFTNSKMMPWSNLVKEIKESPLAKLIPSPEDCGIKILSPEPNQRVPNNFEVTGVWENLPSGFKLWVFVTTMFDDPALYWPRNVVQLNNDGTWRGQIGWGGGKPGDRKKFGVFLVGESGQALIQYYKTAGKEYTAQGVTKWPGIMKLTPDIVECATVEVVLGE